MTSIPATHTAGDTFAHTLALAAYPAGQGWVGTLHLVPAAAGAERVTLDSSADGDAHAFAASASATNAWPAGRWTVLLTMALGAQRATVAQGQLLVQPNPASIAAGTDGRSIARKTLDDLLVARSTWAATQGQVRRYKVGDREREFATAADMDREIAFWQAQLAAEDTAAGLQQGRPRRNSLYVRFARPR